MAEISKVGNIPSVYPKIKNDLVKIELLVPYERKELICDITKIEPTTLEKVWFLIKQAPKIIEIIFLIISFLNKLKGFKNMATNNDKKTTILGMIRNILILLITAFAGEKIAELTGIADTLIYAAGAVWALLDTLFAYFTNKPDKK